MTVSDSPRPRHAARSTDSPGDSSDADYADLFQGSVVFVGTPDLEAAVCDWCERSAAAPPPRLRIALVEFLTPSGERHEESTCALCLLAALHYRVRDRRDASDRVHVRFRSAAPAITPREFGTVIPLPRRPFHPAR